MSEQAKAYVSLIPSTKGWERQVGDQIDGPATKAGRNAGTKAGKAFGGSFGSSAKSLIGVGAGLALGGGVLNFLKASNSEARESQKVSAQTAQVIKSTGGAARVSVADINALSGAISAKVGIDDEAIQSGANLLLTFTNIRNETGKGNDVFSQATQTLTDMSAALGTDVKGSAIQLGKALNDPVKGVTALQRVGVTFTAQQKKQIKTLVDSGKTLDAQKIILRELGKEFGGSAAAQATAGDKLNVSFKNLEEQVGTALLPTVDKLAVLLTTKVVPSVSKFLTGMQDGTGAGGDFADVLTDIYKVGKGVVNIVDGLPGPIKKFGAEGLVAYYAVTKLSNGIGGAVTRLSDFRTSLSDTEATGKRLGTTVRNLAGAGGLVLLASTVADTSGSIEQLNQRASAGSDQLRFLKGTAGGAAAGFAAFGPIGAGVGALAGSLFAVSQGSRAANAAAKAGAPDVRGYADTFKILSTNVTAATRSTAEYNLSQTGAIEAGRLLGINEKVLTNAVLGRKPALDKVNEALRVGSVLLEQGTIPHLKSGADAYNALKQSLFGYSNGNKQVSTGLVQDYQKEKAAADRNTAAVKAGRAELLRRPKSVSTKVDADTAPAKRKLTLLDVSISKTVNPKNIPVYADTSHAEAALRRLRAQVGSLAFAFGGGADGNPLTARATGGPVTANRTYLVGERGPELFTSSQSGRITPNNQLQQASAPISAAGQRFALTITNWEAGTGHISAIADSRVDAARAEDGALERSFG